MTDIAPSATPAGEQPPAPAPSAPDVAAPTAIEAVVLAWVASDLANSPVSRATDAWTHIQQALPHLFAKLKEL